MSENITKAWHRYERGRSYNNRLTPNQYTLVRTNTEFFAGNQWINMPDTPAMHRLHKTTVNIIKRVTSLFVASLTSSAASVSFDELSYYSSVPEVSGEGAAPGLPGTGQGLGAHGSSDERSPAVVATAEVQNLLEKFKMDFRVREALFDGAKTGDYCAHFWWDAEAIPYGGAFGKHRGEIKMELVDGINVMFGNPNTPEVERQPYILIVGRETVENLRGELKAHKKKGGDGDEPQPDADYELQTGVGGQTELEADGETGKALYVYMYEKKQGAGGQTTVHVTKATKSCVIYEDVDTGLSRYPIAWGNWEKQKNQYHGRALVTDVIPNQITINLMLSLGLRHMQDLGFPKVVYNSQLIPQWTNEVGQALRVDANTPDFDARRAAAVLPPAEMSGRVLDLLDRTITYTKDCLGATDAQLGNVKPDNTSALMVLQSNAEVPLENTRAGLYEWLEDIGGILLDMMGTYYGTRPVVRDREFQEIAKDPRTGLAELDPMTGMMRTHRVTRRVMVDYDFTRFKNLWFNVRVNAGATNYYSEIAMVQTLDNLRRDKVISDEEYLERIPDKLIPRKEELVRSVRERSGAPMAGGAPGGGSVFNGALSEDKAINALPTGIQGRYSAMPEAAQRALRKLGGITAG